MKKFSLFAVAAVLIGTITFNAGAWATKNFPSASNQNGIQVMYEDFSGGSAGEAPLDFECTNYGGKVTVERETVSEGKEKNVMLLYDTMNPSASDWGGPSAVRNITPVKGIASFEFRFKGVKTNHKFSPLSISIRNGNSSACSVSLDTSNGILNYTYGPSLAVELAGTEVWADNEWVTVRVTLDFNEQKAGVEVWADCLVNSDKKFIPSALYSPGEGKLTYGDLAINSSFTFDNVDNIKFAMSRYEGKSYVDYFAVYKNAKMPQGNKNISAIAPVLETPESVPSGKYVNILYKGEYHYFPAKTLNVNSSVYCSAEDLKNIFGLKYEKTGEGISFNSEKPFAVKDDKIMKNFGIDFVPVRYVLENAGFSVGWIGESSTITVEEK